MKNNVLYFTNPHQVNIKEEEIPSPKKDEVLVKNIISGISAGTEMLFYQGLIPTDLPMDQNITALNQAFTYPFKYGYSSVGKIIEVGSKQLNSLMNRWVFVFNPHESYFCAKAQELILLPSAISPHDAVFLPNMETAVNLVLDGSPLIGENVLVLGLGVVGLLATALLEQFPLSTLIGVDLHPTRRNLGVEFGVKLALDGKEPDVSAQLKSHLKDLKQNDIDLIYELTGNPEALNFAISSVGYEGRIILGSWYGTKSCQIDLGGRYHRNRIKIIASQVSTLASELQGRWNKNRRFQVAFNMLQKIKPSRLISHQFHITEANKAYELLHRNPNEALQVTLTYEE